MSGTVYIISDLHFGHINMARHRGFSSVEEHDSTIIERWNNTVKKRDTVWILGDITMEKKGPYPLLDELNGYKKVVLGNHDRPQDVPELLKYVNFVCGCFQYKGLIFTHVPIHVQETRWEKNIHGHIHEAVIDHPRYVNVCCEQVDYTPQPIGKYLDV